MIHARDSSSYYFIALFSLVCIVCGFASRDVSAMESSGLIIPLYSYPGTVWDELIQDKTAYNSVPIMAVINPANGPGVKDQNYVIGVHNLQNSGIIVLGYVDTKYGSRNFTEIESEMNSYENWYGVNGIFFDAMSNVAGKENFYTSLTDYAKSIGLTYTVGNPGVDTLPSYVGTVDNIIIYDKKDLPPLSLFDGWHENFTKSNFSFVSYGVNDVNKTYLGNVTKSVQYVYITDLTLPNPFLAPPRYIDKLLNMIEKGEQNNGTISVKLNTYSDDDKPLNGFWTTVKSNMNNTSGFSPFAFSAVPGQQYAITVANFGHYVFDHWDDGTTKNPRTIVPTQNVTLTAYYRINQTIENLTNILNQTNSSNVSDQTQVTPSEQIFPPTSQGTITSQMKNIGSIIVNVMYPTGDRAAYTILSFKIYQDTNQTLYRQIDSVPSNPFYIGNLPLNHRYKVEVFVNGMCADIEYVDLEKPTAQLKMSLPLPVGMRLDVLYDDGFTPISNAAVEVESQGNKTWATGSTDTNGESLRFWLEPTSMNNYYVIGVKIDKHISYSYSPVLLYPSYATVSGYEQEIKIITPWPSPISNAINVKVYDTKSNLYAPKDGNLMVAIFDYNGNKIAESQVNPRGEVDFTNIKVGDYILRAQEMQNDAIWGSSKITFDGKTTAFAIYAGFTISKQPN